MQRQDAMPPISVAAETAAPAPRARFALRALPLPVVGVLVFLVSLVAFAPAITGPGHVYFDETWYVPTARQWLADGQLLHPEHPPLAKMLIAAGIKLFGDNPLGWRVMPLLFGALTVTAVWLWAMALTANVALALYAAAITLVDGVIFVQSRIAMLDIFLICFCVLALAAFTAGENARARGAAIRWHLLAGYCLGLAAACKWSGWYLAFGLIGFKLVVALFRHWGARFDGGAPRRLLSTRRAGARRARRLHGLSGRAVPRLFSRLRAATDPRPQPL